jgi:hypothetical protein
MARLNLATKRQLCMRNIRHEEKRTICEAGDYNRLRPGEGSYLPVVSVKKILTENRNPVLIAHMKTKTFGLTLTICFLTGAACFAANPQMGSWKLNEAKSKFAPGSPKNAMVVYEAAGDGVKVTVNGVDAKGKSTHNEWTGKFDGKNHPVTGDPTSEARSYKKIDDRTLELTVWHHGRILTTGRIAVSADGKSRTVTTNGIDAKGKRFKNTAVYDKQ